MLSSNPLITLSMEKFDQVPHLNTTVPLSLLTFRVIIEELKTIGRSQTEFICVSPDTSLGECLSILAKHRILSVPVATRSSFEPTSTKDNIVTLNYHSNLPIGSRYAAVIGIMDLIKAVIEAGPHNEQRALIQPVESALPLYDMNRESYRVWERDIDDTVAETIQKFASGTHRALLTSVASPSSSATIFTQSDLIRYISRNLNCLGQRGEQILSRSVQDVLPRAIRGVEEMAVALESRDSAREALNTLVRRNVSAIPVLSSSGSLKAELSAAAIRGLAPELIPTILDLPVLEFVAKTASSTYPAMCLPNSTIGEICKQIATSKLHRVWIVNNENDKFCVGVVSLTDMLKVFRDFIRDNSIQV